MDRVDARSQSLITIPVAAGWRAEATNPSLSKQKTVVRQLVTNDCVGAKRLVRMIAADGGLFRSIGITVVEVCVLRFTGERWIGRLWYPQPRPVLAKKKFADVSGWTSGEDSSTRNLEAEAQPARRSMPSPSSYSRDHCIAPVARCARPLDPIELRKTHVLRCLHPQAPSR